MSDSIDTYGDLRVEMFGDGYSKIYFHDIDIAYCNRRTTAKRFLSRLANYKSNARISPRIGRVLGYLDYCYVHDIAPTEKHRKKMILMEGLK